MNPVFPAASRPQVRAVTGACCCRCASTDKPSVFAAAGILRLRRRRAATASRLAPLSRACCRSSGLRVMSLCIACTGGLLKNIRLLRCTHHSSLRRTKKYASFLMISYALHPDIFEQPVKNSFFKNPVRYHAPCLRTFYERVCTLSLFEQPGKNSFFKNPVRYARYCLRAASMIFSTSTSCFSQ